MNKCFWLPFSLLLWISCSKSNSEQDTNPKHRTYSEEFRPQFHFSPEANWMNDPNGLVYHEGFYHLYYQYYPHDTKWGPMHWGHAKSKDLIAWEHQPIALYPDSLGLIFSGSAVIDQNNTSGFGQDSISPLVAIFTQHDLIKERAGRNDFQVQSIAYSLDQGKTFTKYDGNPVIPNAQQIRDFRDPKVFWDEERNQWTMVFVAFDKALFYTSPDLKQWTYRSSFGRINNESLAGTTEAPGSYGGVWECPDLFPLVLEDTGETYWILLVSIGNGAPNGGSGTQYFIGDFDGKQFTTQQTEAKWLDYGTDNYAGVTYNNTPNNERIFIGWMSNWQYATVTPTSTWRSAMTIPRKLALQQFGEEIIVTSVPVKQLNAYEKEGFSQANHQLPAIFTLNGKNQQRIRFQIKREHLKDLSVVLSNNKESLDARWDNLGEVFIVNRSNSGVTEFHPEFRNHLHFVPTTNLSALVQVDILLDKSSIEFFIDQGHYVITEQIFPKNEFTKLEINGRQSYTLDSLSISTIEGIWN